MVFSSWCAPSVRWTTVLVSSKIQVRKCLATQKTNHLLKLNYLRVFGKRFSFFFKFSLVFQVWALNRLSAFVFFSSLKRIRIYEPGRYTPIRNSWEYPTGRGRARDRWRSNVVIRRKIDMTQHHLCFHKCRKWLSPLGPLLGTFKLLKTGVMLIDY